MGQKLRLKIFKKDCLSAKLINVILCDTYKTYSTFLFLTFMSTIRLVCEFGGYSLCGCSVSFEAIGWLDYNKKAN